MKIPIQNIYYLLSYAWNKLKEAELVTVTPDDYDQMQDLLARVLINGCNRLFKRGLERSYISVEEPYAGVKGKILFQESLKKNLFRLGLAECSFDEFSHNILHNQLIKSTLKRLAKLQQLDEELKQEVWKTYWLFDGVDDIMLNLSRFQQVRIHRNNYFYDFLIRVCRLIVENTVLDERSGDYLFKDFLRDDRQMASLFEAFVRNFYRTEQKEFRVTREDIQWSAIPLRDSDLALLPKMQTDISLESPDRKMIIDAKFYRETLTSWYDTEKIRSANLYQLYAYLRNLEAKDSSRLNRTCEGILLYPTVQREVDQVFQMGMHRVRIATVDLSQGWRGISGRLLALVHQ